MSIAVNIHYKGTDGSARKFAEEMESSGTNAETVESQDTVFAV